MSSRIAAFLIVAVFIGGAAYKYKSDEDAWQNVEDALFRLESGLRYESLILLRSKLADTDAAIKSYQSTNRIAPANHKNRADNAARAIAYIGIGLDFQTNTEIKETIDAQTLERLDKTAEISTFLPRSCVRGGLIASKSAVSAAFIEKGGGLLSVALNRQIVAGQSIALVGKNPPLVAFDEVRKCQEEELALQLEERQREAGEKSAEKAAEAEGKRAEADREVAEDQKYWSEFEYIVRLDVSPGIRACNFYISDDGSSFPDGLSPGKAMQYGVHKAMTIRDANCGLGDLVEIVKVTVNGHPYTPKWVSQGSSIYIHSYSAVIVPMNP